MNRIRSTEHGYQVLVSPSLDYLLPRWVDGTLGGFSVEEYATLPDAQCRAFDLSDLDWVRLIEIHRLEFDRLTSRARQLLAAHHLPGDLTARLMSEEQLKQAFFDRVLTGHRQMPEVISIRISNPWTRNLKEIANTLSRDRELEITQTTSEGKMIRLTGMTHNNTAYEIELWPSVMLKWQEWHQAHRHLSPERLSQLSDKMKKEAEQLQNTIDTEKFFIR